MNFFIIKWINIVFLPSFFSWIPKALMVDAMSTHKSKAVRANCNKKKLKLILIPNGLTAYFQAADVSLLKSYKAHLLSSLLKSYKAHLLSIINEWKLSGKVTFTKKRNPRKPDDDAVV